MASQSKQFDEHFQCLPWKKINKLVIIQVSNVITLIAGQIVKYQNDLPDENV